MFTGIVEERGVVVELIDLGDSVRLAVQAPVVCADSRAGDSISVSGCCLTVVDNAGGVFTADVMKETLERTSLGGLEPGSPVNLERAVTAGSRLGGHMVQGHVDGTGTLVDRSPSPHWEVLRVGLPVALARYVAVKGSVAVDGVSLTVVDVEDGERPSFTVSLIPSTLERTTLGDAQAGARLNLEVDVIAKYVERLLAGDVR